MATTTTTPKKRPSHRMAILQVHFMQLQDRPAHTSFFLWIFWFTFDWNLTRSTFQSTKRTLWNISFVDPYCVYTTHTHIYTLCQSSVAIRYVYMKRSLARDHCFGKYQMRLNKYWHLVEKETCQKKNTTNYRPIEIVRFFALCVYLLISCLVWIISPCPTLCAMFWVCFFSRFFLVPVHKVFLITLSFIYESSHWHSIRNVIVWYKSDYILVFFCFVLLRVVFFSN